MPKFPKYTISNILIIISIIFTIIGYFFPGFVSEWSINSYYLERGNYFHYFIQFFSGTFIHGGIGHILMNSIFIYYFGNILEIIMGRKKYLIFFLLSTIFIGILLTTVTNGITIGISGFAMALLSYYTLELKSKNNPEYKGGITALIINILIGLYPGISLYGHLFGAIFGIIFYYLTNDFTKKQLVGLFKYKNISKSTEEFRLLNTKKD